MQLFQRLRRVPCREGSTRQIAFEAADLYRRWRVREA